MVPQFRDRVDAGEQFGAARRERGITADTVLAIPRGGLPVGRAVADALDAPLDVVVVKKIGAPGNPEFAIGAVAVDGTVWRNDAAIERTGADDSYIDRKRRDAVDAAREKVERYRRNGRSELAGKSVIIVDDGVATGSTAWASLELVRTEHPDRLVFAVPVGPPDSIADLETVADDVVCLETPQSFRGVAQFYEHFDQISDEDAMAFLHRGVRSFTFPSMCRTCTRRGSTSSVRPVRRRGKQILSTSPHPAKTTLGPTVGRVDRPASSRKRPAGSRYSSSSTPAECRRAR